MTGNGDLEVRALRYAPEAEENDLAVARNPREARECHAKAILIKSGIFPGKTLLYPSTSNSDGIATALALAAKVFTEHGEAPDYESMPYYHELPTFPGVMAGQNVLIGEGSHIAPFVTIGDNVKIGRNCLIESRVTLGSGLCVGDNVRIASGASVAAPAFFHYRQNGAQYVFCGIGGVMLGNCVHIGANAIVQRGTLSNTRIGDNSAIGHGVVIGHDAQIGVNCLIVSMSGISGEVRIEKGASVFGQAGIVEGVCIGAHAIIMAQSRVSKNVPPNSVISGSYNKSHKDELRLRAYIERFMALEYWKRH